MTDEIPTVSIERQLSGVFDGTKVKYRAVAEELVIRDSSGSATACFFCVAYIGGNAGSHRPVMFAFNGGPTSPAHWLHMGALGPKRLKLPDAENAGAPPYPIIDNLECPLDICDIVFIDPVGTGFSRPLGDRKPESFWGLKEDARSIADLIDTWIRRHRRWNSPKYIAAESYGTVRATLVAEILSDRGIALNGLILMSAVQDYQHSRPRVGDGAIMPYVSFLPTFAAAAWHHDRVPHDWPTLKAFLEEVRTFARTEYAAALIANARLPVEEMGAVATRIARLTGLDAAYVRRSRLRVPVQRFFKELLRDAELVVGRLDARYTGAEMDAVGEASEGDPSLFGVSSAFCTAINTHLAELGVGVDRPYLLENFVDKKWNWLPEERNQNGGGYVNVVPNLGRVMRRNRGLKILVPLGYFDFATPFFGAENAFSQFGLDHERIAFTYYAAGHMIFLHEPSRRRLLADLRGFVSGGRVRRGRNR